MEEKTRNFNPDDYDYYVKEYIRKSEDYGRPISYDKLRVKNFNLPDARWYVSHCPDNNIVTWSDFVDWCGFLTPCKEQSKEKIISLIYKIQSELDRPLMYDDFRGRGCYKVSMQYIKKYWGTVNNMKKELGLEIIQESMLDKTLSIEDFDSMVLDICNYVKSDDRKFITTSEIDKNKKWNNYISLNKCAKKFYNKNFSDILLEHGINIGKQGRGTIFDFEDGERTTSLFEFMFSKYLRNYGLKYNVDYFRDVKYSEFIDRYSGTLNCNYVLYVDSKIIYIEIAGIIEPYKEWYYFDKPITRSKSKEKYRLKLKEKEKMLKNNNLMYFILFPCDLTNDNFNSIITDSSLELKHNIESFMKNNIKWSKVKECGELKYTDTIKYGRNVIDYEKSA